MKRQRIAILGGGMGSLCAALGLSARPELRDRYEITVYQDGWLLGGKGANVRNRQRGHRIEEHGLHLFMGFYENAFGVMREVYRENNRPPGSPLSTFDDAFKPGGGIVVEEKTENGWEHWSYDPPDNGLRPGLGQDPPSVREYLQLGVTQMLDYLRQTHEQTLAQNHARLPILKRLHDVVVELGTWIHVAMAAGSLVAGIAGKHGAHSARRLRGTQPPDGVVGALQAFLKRLWQLIEAEVARDAVLRRLWITFDFQIVNLVGMLRDGLFAEDADISALDHIEYRQWLRDHGASEMTVQSSLVNALYNLAFGAPDGAGAGVALIGTLRLILGYKGAVLWKMQAGMGETIFSPIYEVLKKRGVRFEFFHKVRNLRLSADHRELEAIEIGVQARTKSGEEYQPLIDVGGLPCWPEAPLVEQLEDEERLRPTPLPPNSFACTWPETPRRLVRGVDYDTAILGISIGAFPHICKELIDASPRWRAMVENVATIKTVAMQLWLDPELADTGWPLEPPILGTYEPPFESWADMTHLLPLEPWPGSYKPRTIAYLCGTLDDGKTPWSETDRARDEVRTQVHAREWLERHSAHLFPRISDPVSGALDWSHLHDPEGGHGPDRLARQYVRINCDPSDRYVLSVPGTTHLRLRVDESGFEGLVLAGDWVRTGLDAGCVEAATMSGLQASRAICGFPEKVIGEEQRLRPAGKPRGRGPARYVERPNEQSLRAPYLLESARLTGLAFRADHAALRALVDQCLNEPSGGVLGYVPAAPVAMLVAMFSDAASSMDPFHRNRGTVPEADVAFWVPCLRLRNPDGSPTVPKLVWFLPHVFVDNPAAMLAGREVYGFPKTLVDYDVVHGERGLTRLDVRALALDRFRDDAKVTSHPLLSLERLGDDTRIDLASSWTRRLAALGVPGALTRFFPGGEKGAPPIDGHNLVFLKQFRDATHMDRACYQAIVEARASVRSIRRWGWVDGVYQARWSSLDSHPFVAELGLERGTQQALFGGHADFDFVMQTGHVIWQR